MTVLTADESTFAHRVRELAVSQLLPLVDKGVETRVNRALLSAMAEHGLFRDVFGGSPTEPVSNVAMRLCLLREAIASVSTVAETALALQGLGGYPILQSGGPQTIERWIPGIVNGSVVAAFALTEREAGSDAGALALQAVSDSAGWRLHGEKIWISNAPEADVYTVFARTSPGPSTRGITAFAVAGDADGLSGEHLDMLAPHPIGRLCFDGVRVGPEDVLGDIGAGFKVAMRTLDLFRPSVGAFVVGMAQSAIDLTLEYVSVRQLFGGKLAEQQSVAHKLADLATHLHAARLLVYEAARTYDAGASRSEITKLAAMAKLFATETAQMIVDQCVQLHGARALERGHLLEHLYRDVRAPRIYEGASEVQRSIIARELYKERNVL